MWKFLKFLKSDKTVVDCLKSSMEGAKGSEMLLQLYINM